MENHMLAQVNSLPNMIRSEFDRLDETVRKLLTHNEILSTKRIVIAGCGDSYFAALAAELAFESLTGIPVESLPAMTAGRYALPHYPKDFPYNPLVVGISVSGSVSRTAEAMQVANAQGAFTIGITGNRDSRLAGSVQRVLDCSMPQFVDGPGVRSYRASLLTLYLLAIRFSEVLGRISQDEGIALRQQLKDTADAIEATLIASSASLKKLAEELQQVSWFTFTGDGPNLATAHFAAAKIVEASGYNAMGQDTEEWAHLQYFVSRERNSPTFVISSGGRGHSRLAELVGVMKRVGRNVIGILPEGDTLVGPQIGQVISVKGDTPEIFAPMVYAVPAEVFAAYHAEAIGAGYFRSNEPLYQVSDNTIRSSKVVGGSFPKRTN